MKNIGLWIIGMFLFGTVFAAENTKEITSEVLVKSSHSWDGKRLPKYPWGRPEVQILKIKIPAGAELVPHKHTVINAGVLTQGELTVITKDNKILHLKAGDPIVEVVNTLHYGKNEGTGDAEIIVFYAGRQGMPITIKH